MNIIRT